MEIEHQLFWTPDHNQSDISNEIDEMLERAYFTRAWLDGNFETDSFMDYLNEKGVDLWEFIRQLDSREIITL